jgi:hypothetical protein
MQQELHHHYKFFLFFFTKMICFAAYRKLCAYIISQFFHILTVQWHNEKKILQVPYYASHVCKNNLNLFILCLGISRQKESWLFFHFKSDTITYIQFRNLFHFPPSLKLSRTATYLVFIWSYCHMNFFDFPSSWKDLYMRSLGHLLPLFVARSYDHANENSNKRWSKWRDLHITDKRSHDCALHRVTSLEQLSVAEFSGE